MAKTFLEKLSDPAKVAHVEPIPPGMQSRLGIGTLLIPSPIEVDGVMRQVRKGKLTTSGEIRDVLARKHKATATCAIVTGIYCRIAAGAAGELEASGRKRVTPYWRTLKAKGELNAKYPGGIESHRALLEAEGHTVVQRGKRFFVADYEQRLASLTSA